MKTVERISDRPEFAWMLDMLASSIGEQKAIYVSVPITTGPRLFSWFRDLIARGEPLPDPRRPEGNHERRQVILEPNLRDAQALVTRLRGLKKEPVIDPSILRDVPGWRQEDYISLWEGVIERFVAQIVFADGWNFSFGCAHEFLFATNRKVATLDSNFEPISRADGIRKIAEAVRNLEEVGADVSFLIALLAEADEMAAVEHCHISIEQPNIENRANLGDGRKLLFKDETLDWLAERGNVAQFVSCDPRMQQRFCRVNGYARNHRFGSLQDAVQTLFRVAGEEQVNIRTFKPESPHGNPFRTRIATVSAAFSVIRELTSKGYFCICNELVNECDGGVSGVAQGDWLEFAPDIFPRDIESRGVTVLPRGFGLKILERIYGHRPAIDYPHDQRIEFTVTMARRGHRADRTIIWEVTDNAPVLGGAPIRWPNPLSRMIGDKVFGLLVADTLGFLVPNTITISRRIPVFTFGRATGSQEYWIRTCPREPIPGFFTTHHGWLDPFHLLAKEDPEGTQLASVLSQEAIRAEFSGKVLTRDDGSAFVEGVVGSGQDFMVGARPPERLPEVVVKRVRLVHRSLLESLNGISFEWADDGRRTWILQLHLGISQSSETVVVEGPAIEYRDFSVKDGLEALYRLVEKVKGRGIGIQLLGQVGVTSHMGDLLRRERIPSRIVPDSA
ncbi:MAG: hypothetical protein HY040_13830 [Planctomycetes bacterium]|nr:hypothetical protein [Planctomycetota bacterium]